MQNSDIESASNGTRTTQKPCIQLVENLLAPQKIRKRPITLQMRRCQTTTREKHSKQKCLRREDSGFQQGKIRFEEQRFAYDVVVEWRHEAV